MTNPSLEATCLSCKDLKTRDWYAWNDFQPPKPDYFHIVGEVYVPNPGVNPLLVPTEPQGINPSILLLELYLCQASGLWPQIFVWKSVRYDKKITDGYSSFEIRCDGNVISTGKVEDTH